MKTGFIGLDLITGGLPEGGICQVIDSGMATGKTSLALSIASNVSNRGEVVLYVAMEDVITKRIAENFGVNNDSFLLLDDPSLIVEAVGDLRPTLVVADSVSSMGDEDRQYSSISKLCRLLREASPASVFLFLNQQRMHKFSISFSGDRHLEKWLSMNVSLTPAGTIIKGFRRVGSKVNVTVRMLRPYSPSVSFIMPMMFETGFSVRDDLIMRGVESGVIEKGRASSSIDDLKSMENSIIEKWNLKLRER